MRSQPTRKYQSNDDVYTPDALARSCVEALRPSGRILEPCEGGGAFSRALAGYGTVLTTDANRGELSDQFGFWSERVDWIVTNPPWSQFRVFLVHAMSLADHVCFLASVNHWWTKRRVREVESAGFGYRQLLLCDWPKEWPSSGFALGMMHLERAYTGPLHIEKLTAGGKLPSHGVKGR